jgi:hypothetical protein
LIIAVQGELNDGCEGLCFDVILKNGFGSGACPNPYQVTIAVAIFATRRYQTQK